MEGPSGDISLEIKDDENHSVWNMFNKWCNNEKENKIPNELLTVYKKDNDNTAPTVCGSFIPVLSTGAIMNCDKGNMPVYTVNTRVFASMSETIEKLDFNYYREDAIKDALKVNGHFTLTEKTVEKILDAFPTFFDGEDLSIEDTNAYNIYETEVLLKDPLSYQVKVDYPDTFTIVKSADKEKTSLIEKIKKKLNL